MIQKSVWEVEVKINVTVEKVWKAIEDISLIPAYHPVVGKVEFVTGESKRAPGVEYKCIVPKGPQKGWCVEKVVENIPNKKMSIAFGEDSWGLGKMVSDFLSELTLTPTKNNNTILLLKAFYNPVGLKMRFFDPLVMRRMMRKRAKRTLLGLKELLESQN